MERLGKPRHGRGGQRLSEREASESNLSILLYDLGFITRLALAA